MKKRRRGRPPKAAQKRIKVPMYLPPQFVADLKAYVAHLRREVPGASRGDVILDALEHHRPFLKWRTQQRH
jgi:hypothetical protein